MDKSGHWGTGFEVYNPIPIPYWSSFLVCLVCTLVHKTQVSSHQDGIEQLFLWQCCCCCDELYPLKLWGRISPFFFKLLHIRCLIKRTENVKQFIQSTFLKGARVHQMCEVLFLRHFFMITLTKNVLNPESCLALFLNIKEIKEKKTSKTTWRI